MVCRHFKRIYIERGLAHPLPHLRTADDATGGDAPEVVPNDERSATPTAALKPGEPVESPRGARDYPHLLAAAVVRGRLRNGLLDARREGCARHSNASPVATSDGLDRTCAGGSVAVLPR